MSNIKDLLEWLGNSGICIIFAPPRTGKTALLTALLNEFAFDYERNKKMRRQIEQLNENGFELSIGQHCVYSNYDINFKKYRYSRRRSYMFNPYKYGFHNNKVDVFFTRPCGVFGITEGQKYFNSRKSKNYPDWQSRAFEQCGHNELLFLIDVQRPMLIDLNIRELSKFIEVISLEKVYKHGRISKMTWKLRLIDNSFLLDRYLSGGREIKVPEIEMSINYCVFDLYGVPCCAVYGDYQYAVAE